MKINKFEASPAQNVFWISKGNHDSHLTVLYGRIDENKNYVCLGIVWKEAISENSNPYDPNDIDKDSVFTTLNSVKIYCFDKGWFLI